MDDPQDCSEILAYMELQFKSENALVDHVARVKAVSSKDILDAAKYVSSRRFVGHSHSKTKTISLRKVKDLQNCTNN